MAGSRVWFITGCSTGLGRTLALEVLERGDRCVVTARHREQIEDIVAPHPETAMAVALDVTDDAQRADAVAQAEARFGAIDVLVNNAGYGYLVSVEDGDDGEIRAMFETNLFGAAALIRTVLPGMRARGRGHIVNVSSAGGLVANIGSGYYAATKFGLEGLSEALAQEVEAHGIRVTCVEPGPFRTDWAGRSLRVGPTCSAYADSVGKRVGALQAHSGRQSGDPERAAAAMIRLVESPNPPLNLVLGRAGLQRVRAKLDRLQRSLSDWETVTVGADFPDSA